MRRLALVALLAACSGKHGSSTTFVPLVTDHGEAVAARVLLIGKDGPLHVGTLDVYGKRQGSAACVIGPDAIATWNGIVLARGTAKISVGADTCSPSPAIPYGTYEVWAWRGLEYDLWTGTVDLSAGKGTVELAIPLTRAWKPEGTLAADLHVHAHGSNDSTMPNTQRVMTQAAAGIQVTGIADHNRFGDVKAEIQQLGMQRVIASISSDEVTNDLVHTGVYPVPVDTTKPNNGAPSDDEIKKMSPTQIFARLHELSTHPIVQVNHPRYRVTALFDGTGWNGTSWPPPFPTTFDAIEVLSGYAAANAPDDRRIDEVVRDFFTLTNHGVLVAAMGNSDTHDFNWVVDGTARTYVYAKTDPASFDETKFVDAIRARHTVATTGPWLAVSASSSGASVGPGETLTVNGDVSIDIHLQQASFVHTQRVRVMMGTLNGTEVVQTYEVTPDATHEHYLLVVHIDPAKVGDRDTWLSVTADGDTALPLAITGSYQSEKWKRPGVTPFAITSPILVDVNGDGRWVAPQQ